MCVIKGSAFLWHQVRCMMSVLFMIGRGEDDESIIDLLFDVDTIKERPNYEIAPDANLILSECGFDDVDWIDNVVSDIETFKVYHKQFEEQAIAMCLSDVMMRQYHERPQLKQSDKDLQPYPRIKENDDDRIDWEEVVESVTKARKRQRFGAEEITSIRKAEERAHAIKRRDAKALDK